MVYSLDWKKALITSVLILSLVFGFVGSVAGQETSIFMMADNFDDYVVKAYGGNDGPGMWLQDVGGGGNAVYRIVSSGGKTFYKLESVDAVFVKALLPYYFLLIYIGPQNFSTSVTMKVDKGEGGVIFRAQPVKVDNSYYLRKYYLATVYKNTGKVALWYVDETEGPGVGPRLAYVDVPDSVDLDDWFTMTVTVKGDNIRVSVGGQEVINVNDDRLTYGTIGLYTYYGGAASFDFVNWMAFVSPTTQTVTTTVTTTATGSASTVTSTVTESTTVTTTATGEMTVTETATTTLPPETVTSTVTSTATTTQATTITEKETETKTVTETTTATSTVTEAGGLRCLIATAAFGSEIAPQVQALRGFRDGFVMRTFAGENFMKAFNAFYYSWSPYVAQAEYGNPALRNTIKTAIYPLLFSLDFSKRAAEPFSMIPELAVLVSGLVAASLIGLIYIAPVAISVYLILMWRGKRLNVNLLYPAAALTLGLVMFALAEALMSPLLMIFASSVIVLSAIAIGGIAPLKIFSVQNIKRKF